MSTGTLLSTAKYTSDLSQRTKTSRTSGSLRCRTLRAVRNRLVVSLRVILVLLEVLRLLLLLTGWCHAWWGLDSCATNCSAGWYFPLGGASASLDVVVSLGIWIPLCDLYGWL